MPPRPFVAVALLLRRVLLSLADRVVPAQAAMAWRIWGIGQTQALRAFARLRIADLLAEGPMTSAELAARTRSDPDTLHRVLRALVTEGFMRLRRDGRFAHNRLSRTFISHTTGSMRDFADYFGSTSNVQAWSDLDYTLAHGTRAFERVHGMTVWAWFDTHADEGDVFADAMGSLTELYAPAVASTSPFEGLQRVCDVGGGRGTLLAEVLRRHPHVQGVLIDADGMLDAARSYLAAHAVLDRVELIAGSFFDGVPTGCDAYVLKNILHDWDDPTCLRILATCRRAMAPGARLVIVETLVEDDTIHDIGPLSDLQMMISTSGGRERGVAGFRALLEQCGFGDMRVVSSASPMSVIAAIATDGQTHEHP